MAEQLTFDLPVRPALGREDFFVTRSNELALSAIEAWADWPRARMVLTGPPGAGKTHLAQVWAGLSNARIIAACDLTSETAEAVAAGPLCLEDADRGVDETALFHLLNATDASGTPLLLTARIPPARWSVALPDLASRLQAASVVALDSPDDALLKVLLLKLFADRQIDVTPALVDYLATRIDRSHAAARAIVKALDAAALAEKKVINRRLAARILDRDASHDA